VWESKVDNRPLKFHLAGINNQNFIMRDEETGSWWQQVSGEAIQGPLKGKHLNAVFWDELTFAVWKREQPNGRVLLPDERVQAQYEAANWEEVYAKYRVVVPTDAADKLSGRALVVGLEINQSGKKVEKAYPFDALQKQRLILDEVGGVPLFVVVGEDQKSARAFERKLDSRVLELFVKAEGKNWQMMDAETGSVWDFTGKAVSGTLAGQQLKPIPILKDYWFDWKIYHPKTAVYQLGEQ